MIEKRAFINGEFVNSKNKVDIISPLTLETYGQIPSLTAEDINATYAYARKAFKGWRDLLQEERTNFIKEFNKLLLKNKKELAEIMHNEIGKNINEAIVEIERTTEYIDETISAWEKMATNIVKIKNKVAYQKHIPLGIVLAISPFNYPVNLSLAKIIPALLSGNVVVFKAATNGSLTGGFIAELLAEVKMPSGVFNYVTGRGRDIGDILTSHKEIDMVTFTGGVSVGKGIAKNVTLKPMILELGGNDAAYIRYDADIEKALKETIGGAFGYAGQRCTAIKRVILHKEIADEFIERLTPMVEELNLNPVIDMSSANYIKELYDDALGRGDKIITGGQFNQNMIAPTLIKTTPTSRVWNEEPFGPLLPLVFVNDDKEAIELMNDTNFGLQNSIFTTDIDWALSIAPTVESGSVNINAKSSRGPDIFPFSGVKDSGFGTQGIEYALKSMTRIINIVNNE